MGHVTCVAEMVVTCDLYHITFKSTHHIQENAIWCIIWIIAHKGLVFNPPLLSTYIGLLPESWQNSLIWHPWSQQPITTLKEGINWDSFCTVQTGMRNTLRRRTKLNNDIFISLQSLTRLQCYSAPGWKNNIHHLQLAKKTVLV